MNGGNKAYPIRINISAFFNHADKLQAGFTKAPIFDCANKICFLYAASTDRKRTTVAEELGRLFTECTYMPT